MEKALPVFSNTPRILHRAGAVLLVGAVALLGLGTNALANDYGGPYWLYPDNDLHTFWYSASLGPKWIEAADKARLEQIGRGTAMSTSKLTSKTSSTDVVAYVADYGDARWWGKTSCPLSARKWTSKGRLCDRFIVRFNIEHGPFSQWEKEMLACHEFGHTVGLRHYKTHPGSHTCMERSHFHVTFNSHDRNHIDDYICANYTCSSW